MITLDSYKAVLKSHNLKATPQRIAVHKAMMELGHASADMVSENIASKGGIKVSVASVYNILSQMALWGIYRHRLSSNSKMYFDVNTHRHVHLYDTVGNTFRDIEDEELSALVEAHFKGRRFKGYKLDGADITLMCHPSKIKRNIK